MPSGRLTRALPLRGGALASFLPSLLVAVIVALLGSSVLGACTQSPGPPPNPTSSANATNPANLANPANPTGARLENGMTAVPEQAGCFVEEDVPSDLQPQPGELWPGAAQERSVAQRFTRRDTAGCEQTAKPPVDCEGGAFPWALSQDRETYAWSGARTVVAGIAAARLVAGSDLSKGGVALEYVLLRFDPGDPARFTTGGLLGDLVRRCGHARPGSVGGVNGLVATQPSFLGPGNPAARGVLVSAGDDLIWLLLDGGAWSPDSERHAVGLAAQRLHAG